MRTRPGSSIWFGFVFVSFWLGSAQAQISTANQKIEAKVLADLRQNGRTTFFVVLSERANVSSAATITNWRVRGEAVVDSLKEVAGRTQRPILDFLANANAEVTPFWIVNTIKVTTTDEQLIEWLAAMATVAAIKADEALPIPEPQPGAQEPTVQAVEWNVAQVAAPDVWNQFGVKGEGIIVASIDSGVQFNHPALVTHYRGWLGGNT